MTAAKTDDRPVIVLGEHSFPCVPKHLPFGTLLKYAKDDIDLTALHHIIVKLLAPEQLDEFWDALDEVGIDEGQKAIAKALESYTARPTKKP